MKQRLIEVSYGLHQNIVVTAVSEWRKRLRDCVRKHRRKLNIYFRLWTECDS